MNTKKIYVNRARTNAFPWAPLLAILALTACERSADKSELKADIEKANEEWMSAVKNQDASAVAGMYAEDAFILPPNAPAIQGREGVKNFFSGAMGSGIKDVRLVTQAVDGNSEIAIEKGSYEMMSDDGKVVDKGKYLVHWKNVDGKWMFQHDMFNSDLPAVNALNFQKGNVVGVHVFDVKLKRGVTMEKFVDFYKNTVIPEFGRQWPEAKILITRGLRGENANRFGMLYLFESDDVRNKYFKADGSVTEAGQLIVNKMKSTMDQRDQFHNGYTTKYTDWVVE